MKFTNEEKTILIAIIAAAAAGLLINLIFSYNKKLSEKPAQSAALIININTASADDLDRLPGVGKVIAGRIVEYRKANGPFRNTAELMKVRGITAKKIEAFKAFVTVSIQNPKSKIQNTQ
jgi:competence ComEA-like helix-hairpin-helix protein